MKKLLSFLQNHIFKIFILLFLIYIIIRIEVINNKINSIETFVSILNNDLSSIERTVDDIDSKVDDIRSKFGDMPKLLGLKDVTFNHKPYEPKEQPKKMLNRDFNSIKKRVQYKLKSALRNALSTLIALKGFNMANTNKMEQ
ncbi:MAG: hypothetical protein IPH11_04810 [Ignavibacteriales bacterium]|nr:hypothetical protein [Ignavibacteriales bacterium]